jgi:hypothetical protein
MPAPLYYAVTVPGDGRGMNRLAAISQWSRRLGFLVAKEVIQ